MAKILWTQRANFGPSARTAGAMAYDSTRSRIVLFGGTIFESNFGDTWEWDGSFWTQMEDIGVPPRANTAMVYDSARKVSILFGGIGENEQAVGDTWQWDGIDWTQLSESGPSARGFHAMAFDSTRKRTVLFGGQTVGQSSQVLSDSWEFDGTDWTQQQDTGPSPRINHSMAYDSVGGRVVLFGGDSNLGAALGDTWAWDGKEWVQIAEFGPSARFSAAMVSSGGSNLILFGGVTSADGAQVPQADTWEFDGKLWTERQDIGPGSLQGMAMAFDSGRSTAVLFGGLSVATNNEKQASPNPLSSLTWEAPITPVVVPPAAVGVASLFVPPNVKFSVPINLTITLTGASPMGGVVVNLGDTLLNPSAGNSHLVTVTIAAGLTALTLPVVFPLPGSVTVVASVGTTPAVSLGVDVGL